MRPILVIGILVGGMLIFASTKACAVAPPESPAIELRKAKLHFDYVIDAIAPQEVANENTDVFAAVVPTATVQTLTVKPHKHAAYRARQETEHSESTAYTSPYQLSPWPRICTLDYARYNTLAVHSYPWRSQYRS